MAKRLAAAALAFLGLFVAKVLFRVFLEISLDVLGWVACTGLGIVAVLVVVALARKKSESAEPTDPPPTD
jgi:hypothetical protein